MFAAEVTVCFDLVQILKLAFYAGSSSAARLIPSVDRHRSLLQVLDINSCGGRTYITGEEVCIRVGVSAIKTSLR